MSNYPEATGLETNLETLLTRQSKQNIVIYLLRNLVLVLLQFCFNATPIITTILRFAP